MASSYAWVHRLYNPSVCAAVHVTRLSNLFDFFSWLNLRSVRSLQSVTSDHIYLYVEQRAFGKEWAAEVPQRLYKFLLQTQAEGKELPVKKRGTKIARAVVYKRANLIRYDSGCASLLYGASILDWVKMNGLENIQQTSLEEILSVQQSTPIKLVGETLHAACLPIDELWLWRRHFPHENLKFDPFPGGCGRLAKSLGRTSGKHPTLPPRLAVSYFSDALKWVLDFAPIIIREVCEKRDVNLSALNKKLNKAGLDIEVVALKVSSIPKRKLTTTRLLEMLATACFVVICSLTARRIDEVCDLGGGCVLKDQEGHYWLKIYIEKTLQEYDQIPIPVSVFKAIGVLEKISLTARDQSKNYSVWQFHLGGIGRIREIKPERFLNDLAHINRTQLSAEEWAFSAHQFRRFFAILYFWRYEMGDLPGISHHLRHFDLEMTKRYVTDVEFGRVWKDVEAEWQGATIRAIVDGSRGVGGKAGDRLKKEAGKLLQRYRKTVDVVAPERAVEHLQRLAKRWGSEFKEHEWGTICACPSNTKLSEAAMCKGDAKIGPVFANADESSCAACPFAIHTERFPEKAAQALALRKSTAAACSDDPFVSKLMNTQIHTLESVFDKFEVKQLLIEEAFE